MRGLGLFAFAAGFLVVAVLPVRAGSPPAVIVPGQMNVGPTGAFTYTIPIAVPPGTAGMVPALSLDYSSQNGDGLQGLGWALSGLPSIGRCPRTAAQDSVHGGVNYDANDKFCMEGQRLFAVSGTYGANGTEYRTEVEGFAKIVSYGTAGSGPAYFKVWTKAGQVMEFGNTADSRIEAVGTSTARAWAVNRIADTVGNYLTVTYTDDQTNGQAYPTQIDYTGNAGASLTPYNSVRFTYTTRSDITPAYQAGSLMQTTKLLTNIKTYQGAATLVSDYRLAYQAGTSTTHSRLTSVTLCDGSGTPICLEPTTFGWQGGGTPTLSTTTPPSLPGLTPVTATPIVNIVAGDFDGDGLTDAAPVRNDNPSNCSSTTPYAFYLATQSGPYTGWNPTLTSIDDSAHTSTTSAYCINNPPFGGLSAYTPSDFNGDGLADIGANISQIYISSFFTTMRTATGFVAHSSGSHPTSGGIFLDMDGDGRTDILLGSTLYTINSDGSFSTSTLSLGGGLGFGDFDGDGCTDPWSQLYPQTLVIYYGCNPAVSSYSNAAISPHNPSGGGPDPLVGDFNGDGKSDYIDTTGKLFLSTGTAMVYSGWTKPSTWTSLTFQGDWNGDGKMDLMGTTTTGSPNYHFFLSTGTGFVELAGVAAPTSGTAASFITVGSALSPTLADWNGDGIPDLWIETATSRTLYYFDYVPELLTSVSNGLGGTTTVSYDRLNKNGTFYTKGTGSTYPIQDMDGPVYVVSRVDSSNGIGSCVPPGTMTGCYGTTYAYGGAKTSLDGRGFLGFSQMSVTDVQSHIVQTTTYRTDYPYTGMVAAQTKVCPATYCSAGAVTLSSTANTYTATSLGGTRYFVSLQQSVAAANDADGTALPTVTTAYTYDAYGNALTVRADVTGGSYTLTTNTYNNDTANWFLGRMLTSQTRSVVGASDITRHSSFAYSATTGLMTQEVAEPGNNTCNSGASSCTLTTDYTYDAFGNRLTAQVSGSGITTRTTTNGYDAKGRFATTLTNALSQAETWVFDERFGTPTSHTGPNGLATAWTYDNFGRRTLETRPDGNKTGYIYEVITVPTGLPATTAARVKINDLNAAGSPNGPGRRDYYDSLLRPLGSDTTGFNLAVIRAETQYDANGRVLRSSRPYYTSGGTPKWTTFTYDALGRATLAVFPDASDTAYAYHGLSSSVTNDKGQVTTTVKNAQGLNASVTDAAGKTTAYVYDAFGNLVSVTDPAGNVTANTYDVRGRRITSSDPDLGAWSYVYNVLDQLTSQTDAMSQTTTLAYDLLGRITGQVQGGVTTGWTWGTSAAAHEIGQLASTTTGSGYTRTHGYDAYGRPATTTLTIDGTGYATTTAYTGDGRADTVTYPSGFVAKYVYTSTGYLSQIKDNATAAVLWTTNARDAELHLTQSTLGNGVAVDQAFDANTGLIQQVAAGPSHAIATLSYAFDTIGNLTSRQDTLLGYTEAFCYDALNRLTDSAMTSGGSTCTTGSNHKSVTYNDIGNILTKTGAGTYTYAAPHKHAVVHVTGTASGAANPYYRYDLNGNLACVSTSSSATYTSCTSPVRTVSYTAFNMAATITQGASSYAFSYDSEHQRIKQVAPGLTTLYLNAQGAMSEKLVGGSSTTWRDYIQADGKMVAQRDKVVSTGVVTWSYFVTDHLGSVAVITNAAGAIAEQLGYDAWGKRRNAAGTDAACGTISSAASRGFTGHEMIDGLCLINMNARIYDPDLGRFMAADTMVADTLNLQDWNAYTYVNNNPLSFTDPTGHAMDDPGYHWDPYAWNLSLFGSCYGNCSSGGGSTGPTIILMNLSVTAIARSVNGPSKNPSNLPNANTSPNIAAMAPALPGGAQETVIVTRSKNFADRGCFGGCGAPTLPSGQMAANLWAANARPATSSTTLSRWPVPGFPRLNKKDKPGEGDGAFGSCRGRGCARLHKGIDVQAPVGVDVVAGASGTVIDTPSDPNGYGKQVRISHENGVETRSAHLDSLIVTVGQQVQAGDKIGTVGTTGNPPPGGDSHLHFEVIINGVPVNPLDHLPTQPPDEPILPVPYQWRN